MTTNQIVKTMINEKDFEQAIQGCVKYEVHGKQQASAAVFELAKQMAKERDERMKLYLENRIKELFDIEARELKELDKFEPQSAERLAQWELIRELAHKRSELESARKFLLSNAEYSGTPASSLAQEAEGKEDMVLLLREWKQRFEAEYPTVARSGMDTLYNRTLVAIAETLTPPSSNKIN